MYIACDIGGTKFRIAKSVDLVNFDEPIIKETPDDPYDGLKMIAETIRELVANDPIDAMVFGIAGVLNSDHNFLLKSPHLPKWENVPIREFFEVEFGGVDGNTESQLKGTKIYIENDTDIVGLGEAVSGAGRGYEIVVYITISTGIGGVKIVNGKFEKNRFGFEPGFQILNNKTGENWEDVASGTAVENKYKTHPKEVAKTEAWRGIENDIVIGLHNSILHWSPDVVVVGGSMSKDLNPQNLRDGLRKIMKIHPEIPEINVAELGSIGGIHGGFAYLRQKK